MLDVGTIIALVAALVGPLGAYLVAARRFSGQIETSAASELWAESSAIRVWSAARIKELQEEIAELREDLEERDVRLRAAYRRIEELEAAV